MDLFETLVPVSVVTDKLEVVETTVPPHVHNTDVSPRVVAHVIANDSEVVSDGNANLVVDANKPDCLR